MMSFRKLSLYVAVAALSLNFAACSKKNAELETDYATKKASAETLIGQINAAKAGMMTDHDLWQKTVADAMAKPGSDAAKLGALKSDLDKHMTDGQAIGALEDSVKSYMNATPDQGDAFKAADDHLGTSFNDLNDKWKSFSDKHTELGKNIMAAVVTSAGDAMKKDSTAAKAEVAKPVAKKEAPKKEAPKTPEASHEHHGAARVPAK